MKKLLLLLTLPLMLAACGESYVPKPMGYFRIALPSKEYAWYNAQCPFSFQVNDAAKIQLLHEEENPDSCWFNIVYPRLNATVHCTYLPVNGNFEVLQQEAYEFAMKHEMKASAIVRKPVDRPDAHVYGQLYMLKGEAASQLQFYVTDSLHHYFRGALYFNSRPNPDSLAPVVEHLRDDIIRLTESISWR
ncbi:MAG: gliding motility lipoprotein GldD [Flavobacteriales bacterium]|nr:gliding motility lipoprotein GldD [Flavobacteriales bacterium]